MSKKPCLRKKKKKHIQGIANEVFPCKYIYLIRRETPHENTGAQAHRKDAKL